MHNNITHSTWAEIDTQAIIHNTQLIKSLTGVQIMAVVKANGYGHGAIQTANAALAGGCNWLGVARVEEALDLRKAGIQSPILLMGYTPPGRLDEVIANSISLAVWDMEQVEATSAAAMRVRTQARLHLKVDTGMSRLGVQVGEAISFAIQLTAKRGIILEGIFTHFARADESHVTTSEAQEALFREVLTELQENRILPPIVHAANSAAGLSRLGTHGNLVRAGIAIYGLHPSPEECRLPEGFRPALAWKTVLCQVKELPPGRGISYGHEYTTRKTERIGTLAVGYADGFRRVRGVQVLVSGHRAPIVGRVCMDQAMVQLDDVQEAKAGDEVVIIGQQGEEVISTDEVAQWWGTINYDVVCGIGARVPRIYL